MRFSFFTTVAMAAISAVTIDANKIDEQVQTWPVDENMLSQAMAEVDVFNLAHSANQAKELAQVDVDMQSEVSSSKSSSSSSSDSSSGTSSSSDDKAQIGAESEDEDYYGLAQINAEIEREEALLAQLDAEIDAQSEASESKSSSSSSSSSSDGSSSSSSDDKAQIGAENEDVYDYANDLAQINAEIEAEAFEAEQKDAIEYFTNFLSQIGVEDSEELLAQLGETISEEQLGMMAMNPDIYMGLAQLANDYQNRETAVDNILTQVGAYEEDDMAEITEMLAQMDTSELEELHTMLAQTDSEVEEQEDW